MGEGTRGRPQKEIRNRERRFESFVTRTEAWGMSIQIAVGNDGFECKGVRHLFTICPSKIRSEYQKYDPVGITYGTYLVIDLSIDLISVEKSERGWSTAPVLEVSGKDDNR